MKVLELKGFKSLRALNAFSTLLLGLKMLPMHAQTPYEQFFEDFKTKTDEEKVGMLRQAALFVEMTPDEVEAMLGFVVDANGVPYGKTNINNLKPEQIFEAIVAVCLEFSKIKIDLLSESEKKKLKTSASTRGNISPDIPTLN